MSSAYSLVDLPRAFRSPGRVWFGAHASERLGEWLQELGLRPGRALLVTDAVVDRLRLAAGIDAGLAAAGFDVHRFAEIPGEPSIEVADHAAALARRIAPALVVGVGGGSVLDVAKLAGALARNPGGVRDYTHVATPRQRFAEAAVPTILVPTTAGTGAEASQNAVVTVGDRKAFANGHPQLLPTGVILDPLLTYSLPPPVTAHTGLDALSHCMEGTLSTNATALTDLVAAQGIGLILGALRRAYASAGSESPDPLSRAHMVLGAYMGGLTLNAGMVLGHSIAYTLANRLHLPHGLSCAIALPYTLAYNRGAAQDRLAGMARAAGVDGQDIVACVERLCRDVGIPDSVRALGLERDRLPHLVDECLDQYPRPNNPRPLDRESLRSLYAAMWEGRPAHEWR
ncbi:MAG: iron-containing alcohol dehydrogenase [Bacillati bacterium ANGP1]|uniref:Iron-containing alcohol dehydrogenase n=1 Tax=Candidatus Segetimicrobium genomatis TaxID=2569760 RepID=A0A537JLZ0_9BACT|nr:MAG: iron-containing alcohol dehydrogenase [Terrabacteria group bacterium ANGP1]